MRIYVASSWRNRIQQEIVAVLRREGHAVYDFRNPSPGNHGFSWSEISANWQSWHPEQYRKALSHPIAIRGYVSDFEAMYEAEACVLVLPCGRSAHLEAGWFVGKGRPLHILILEPCEPELMYRMAAGVYVTIEELCAALRKQASERHENDHG